MPNNTSPKKPERKKIDNTKPRRPDFGCGLSEIGDYRTPVRKALNKGKDSFSFSLDTKFKITVSEQYGIKAYRSNHGIYLGKIKFRLGGEKSPFSNSLVTYPGPIANSSVQRTTVTFPASSRYFFECWRPQLRDKVVIVGYHYIPGYTMYSFVTDSATIANDLSNYHFIVEADKHGGFICEILQKVLSYCPIDEKCKYSFVTIGNQIILLSRSVWGMPIGVVAVNDTNIDI